MLIYQAEKHAFPLLYRVALDVMPVQAFAVPCERVFSSSKGTDTDQRTKLSPVMMEVLQVLKYMFWEERLDFSDAWVTKEDELLVLDIDPAILEDVMSTPGPDA
ncbi:hypothetical protein PLICRDRAFT_119379 [Plicaturopsis crispa FD-325 SS-3]|uniref:HAT C-terminal dimerisation domain-containing protein n=1 Tax=Plicaturopsis crispa FD-325 SS-3 TaxID=944288 RepID=A0A0C9T5Q5_PLICR|nr:hypothetical protein PLICRDRAFT_119379 [Plicaturopsis crispa FD-325 SS-3]